MLRKYTLGMILLHTYHRVLEVIRRLCCVCGFSCIVYCVKLYLLIVEMNGIPRGRYRVVGLNSCISSQHVHCSDGGLFLCLLTWHHITFQPMCTAYVAMWHTRRLFSRVEKACDLAVNRETSLTEWEG